MNTMWVGQHAVDCRGLLWSGDLEELAFFVRCSHSDPLSVPDSRLCLFYTFLCTYPPPSPPLQLDFIWGDLPDSLFWSSGGSGMCIVPWPWAFISTMSKSSIMLGSKLEHEHSGRHLIDTMSISKLFIYKESRPASYIIKLSMLCVYKQLGKVILNFILVLQKYSIHIHYLISL